MGLGRDLNNIAKQGWDYINGVANYVAKNATLENAQKGWNTYVKQSPEELARVARKTMQRENTIMSNLDMNTLENWYSAADKSNADYVTEFNKLKGALKSGNTDEAKAVATSISERFQDGKYLELLQGAESKKLNFEQQIDAAPSESIKRKYIKDTKEKIAKNKIANNYLTSEQQEKIASLAYSAKGKFPQNYFNSGNAKTNQIRVGLAAGTYMGAMTTARIVHGGGLTTDEYGERDIVGIPFI